MECDLFKKPHLLGFYRIGPERSLILLKKKKKKHSGEDSCSYGLCLLICTFPLQSRPYISHLDAPDPGHGWELWAAWEHP